MKADMKGHVTGKFPALVCVGLCLVLRAGFAEEPAEEPAAPGTDAAATEETAPAEPNGDGIKTPRAMSGMSILGNEEAPKALVIIPWKSSEMGDEIGLENSLEDLARPVDKDVFLRELRYYRIRAGKDSSAPSE